jgi:ribosome-interacting GTPase 1
MPRDPKSLERGASTEDSARFDGQRVGREHAVADDDTIEIVMR